MDEPFLAGAELGESAERRDLHDLGVELLTDLDLARQVLDPLAGAGAALFVRGGNEDGAVVLDVDVDLELLLDAADHLPAGADDQADLLLIDGDGEDPRRVLRELRARVGDRLGHQVEDAHAGLLGQVQRLAEELGRQAGHLHVEVNGVDALAGAGDLEVHVAAKLVLGALQVDEQGVAIRALHDGADGDARDRR